MITQDIAKNMGIFVEYKPKTQNIYGVYIVDWEKYNLSGSGITFEDALNDAGIAEYIQLLVKNIADIYPVSEEEALEMLIYSEYIPEFSEIILSSAISMYAYCGYNRESVLRYLQIITGDK